MLFLMVSMVSSTIIDGERLKELKVRWSFLPQLVCFLTFRYAHVIELHDLYSCVVLIKGRRMTLVLPCLEVRGERN
jgi:hypothetical protein